MKNKILSIILILLVLCMYSMPTMAVTQEDVDDLKEQKQEAENKKDEVTEQKNSVMDEISALTAQISKYEGEISELKSKIDKLENSISDKEEEIKKLEKETEEKQNLLIERLVAMYEAGQTTYLDVLLLGKDQAINLGLSYKMITRLLLILVAILVSISTSLVGPITFLGLLTVNLAHELMKTYEHKYILPATICLSWLSLFIAQSVVENLFEATTQVSIIIDLVGGTYFIYLLIKRRHAN